jgi:GntR family transcriptional regulator
MMLFQLNTLDDRPIYAQIADQVKFAVAAALLRPGESVPSVRELAKQLVVNPNTVARAYRDLQSEGILEPVRGIGLQVSEGAPKTCREGRREFVRRRLRDALDEARRSNLALDEIEAILLDEWSRGNGKVKSKATTDGSETNPNGGGR